MFILKPLLQFVSCQLLCGHADYGLLHSHDDPVPISTGENSVLPLLSAGYHGGWLLDTQFEYFTNVSLSAGFWQISLCQHFWLDDGQLWD